MKISRTKALVECAVLLAIATVLSLIKLVDLPYGGSVTIASMLPVVIISYRHGLGYGLLSGAVFGVIQQLLGLNTLSWVTTWQSVVAVILLDYVIAFFVIGLGGMFRKSVPDQAKALVLGSVAVCVLRYICHVISGATVWAGLSIPTAGALVYSLAYNATYMIPETVVLAVAAWYIGASLDFRTEAPVRLHRKAEGAGGTLQRLLGGLALAAAAIFVVVSVFSRLQNGETGEWDLAGLGAVPWVAVCLVTAAGAAAAAVCFILAARKAKN